MHDSQAWLRLWWKEWQETGIFLALFAGFALLGWFVQLPAVRPFLFTHMLDRKYGDFASIITIGAFGVIMTVLMVVATWRVTHDKAQLPMTAILPVSPVQRWVTRYLYPLFLPLVAGVLGGWLLLVQDGTPPLHTPDSPRHGVRGRAFCADDRLHERVRLDIFGRLQYNPVTYAATERHHDSRHRRRGDGARVCD